MATESPIQMIEASGRWGSTSTGIEDLGLLLTGQRFQGRKSSLPPIRSGSAPPSIEGSFAAIENLMFRQNFAASEEQIRSNPSYFGYYMSHVNLNPRLPPPLISGENRDLLRNVRGTGSNRRLTSFDDTFRSSFSLNRGNLSTHKVEPDDDRSPKEENLPQPQSSATDQPHPFIHKPSEEAGNHDDSNPTTTTFSSSSSIDDTRGDMVIKPPVNTSSNPPSQGDGSAITHTTVSLSISNFPKLESERNETGWQQRRQLPVHSEPHPQMVSSPQTFVGMNQFLQNPAAFATFLHSPGFSLPHYATDLGYTPPETLIYPSMLPAGYFPQLYTLGGYAFNPPPVSPYATRSLPNSPFPTPFGNMGQSFNGQSQTSAVNLQVVNNLYGYSGLSFSVEEHKLQSLGGVGPMNPYYLGSPTSMDFLQFPNSPFASPLMLGSPSRVYSGWKGHSGNVATNGPKVQLFLEDIKSSKGRRIELSDIYGHIVAFSVDQFGSRFIQQKLQVCSNEEKESIFKEVVPHALKLITDMFGNYVIQKFLDYGNAEQRRELGNRLEGQILPLSLQMYGCRVIQKALEVFELEHKMKIVNELDGHVLECVRDQNGNHVIQKCIECVPPENIKNVISSFRGQVVALSKHPYGCRVIQRILEHSTDGLDSEFMVHEIMDAVYDLAQDQYGNYVTQYVLEGGKPEERSQIVHKLAGHIVQLSQHKFASNVIEKCLAFGDETAREIMIQEITGCADGNDNLLVMVKDQYANYVVQKVLETCSGHQREALLHRIKIHLDSLKTYTYGKHIVARFEKFYGEEIGALGS